MTDFAGRTDGGRVVYLDNLRSFCILLLFPLHAYYLLDFNPMSWIAWAPELFQMHLLFLLAGLFAAHSLQRSGARLFRRGRLRQLGVPFLLCVLVLNPLSLVFHLVNQTGGVSPALFLDSLQKKMASGNITLHAWFLFCLIAYALVAPALARWLARPRVRAVFARADLAALTLAAGGIVFAAETLQRKILSPLGVGYLPLNVLEFSWAFALGFAFASLPERLTQFHRPAPRVLALVLIAGSAFLMLPEWRAVIFPFLKVAICVCLCQSLLWAARRYANTETPLSRSFARDSYGIYVLHWLVLFALAAALPLDRLPEALAYGLITVLALATTWALQAYGIRHRPALAWLVTGAAPRPADSPAVRRAARPSSA